jgi:hypothetical protein
MLGEHRARVNDPFRLDTWLNDIQLLAARPLAEREERAPYRLYQLIMENRNSFCQGVSDHVLAYLPEGTSLEVTIYLTALEGSAPAFAADGRIVFSLSHPLFMGAAWLHEPAGLTTFYNQALHELFHIGFGSSFVPPTLEQHMENEVVIDMLIALQNEGMATYISYELNPVYPSPFEWYIYLVGREAVVRMYIHDMNELFAVAQTKPTGEAYDDIYRRIAMLGYQRKGFYIIGAYMAMTIESELGREALVQTVVDGYEAFVRTYNSVAEETMDIQWSTTP